LNVEQERISIERFVVDRDPVLRWDEFEHRESALGRLASLPQYQIASRSSCVFAAAASFRIARATTFVNASDLPSSCFQRRVSQTRIFFHL